MKAEKGFFTIKKRMDFGQSIQAVYTKHNKAKITSIFWNQNLNAYATYDEKTMHVWNPQNGENLFKVNFFDAAKTHSVSCAIYTNKLSLYLAATTDFKLLVFNEHLHFVQALPLKVRLINFMHFLEDKLKIITAGIDGCFVFTF